MLICKTDITWQIHLPWAVLVNAVWHGNSSKIALLHIHTECWAGLQVLPQRSRFPIEKSCDDISLIGKSFITVAVACPYIMKRQLQIIPTNICEVRQTILEELAHLIRVLWPWIIPLWSEPVGQNNVSIVYLFKISKSNHRIFYSFIGRWYY